MEQHGQWKQKLHNLPDRINEKLNNMKNINICNELIADKQSTLFSILSLYTYAKNPKIFGFFEKACLFINASNCSMLKKKRIHCCTMFQQHLFH